MDLVSALVLGQGDISSPLWADAPQRHPHHSPVPVDLEATHPVEDLHLQLTPSTAAPHVPGCVAAHASGLSSELPPLKDCSPLFFQCLLAQEVWREAAVIRLSVTSEEAFWSSLSGGFFRREADWRRIFATLWQSGLTGAKSSSGASPHPATSSYTRPRGSIFPSTEAAYASRTMYPCYDRLRCHTFSLT